MKNCNDYFQDMNREEFKKFLENSKIEFEEEGSGEIIYTEQIESEVKFSIHGTFKPKKLINETKGEIERVPDNNSDFLMAC